MGDLQARIARLSPAKWRLLLARTRSGAAPRVPSEVRRKGGGAIWPASNPQQRLWVPSQIESTRQAYNIAIALRLRGRLDVPAFVAAWRDVVARHDALRTSFIDRAGVPYQSIAPVSQALPVVDLESVCAPEELRALQEIVRSLSRRAFDLTTPPLWRACLCRANAVTHTFVLAAHHIICDGASIGIVLRDLARAYAARACGAAPDDVPAVQYPEYAAAKDEALASDPPTGDQAYWTSLLATRTWPEVLPGLRRRATGDFRGATHSFVLDEPLCAALRARCQEQSSTLFMALLAAWQILLSWYAGGSDVIVGAAYDNRDDAESGSVVGLLVNMLPLRGSGVCDRSFRDYLAEVKRTVLDACDHRRLPFARLVEHLRLDADARRLPIFQTTFDLQQMPLDPLAWPGLVAELMPIDTGIVPYEIELGMVDAGRQILGTLRYDRDLFDAGTIERLSSQLTALLRHVCADVDVSLSQLPLLDESARDLLLDVWNRTERGYPRDADLDTLATRRARERADAVALEIGDHQVTFDALHRRAALFARWLREHHAEGAHVAIVGGRSLEYVVSVLGVIKAGMAYIPLTPDQPPARIAAMLGDGRAEVVIVEPGVEPGARAALEVAGLPIVTLESAVPASDAPLPPCAGGGDAVAYIMFTSGSTGTPKGVMVAHRAIARLVIGSTFPAVTPADRIAFASNIAFDAVTFEVWGALLNGSRLVAIDRDVLLSPHRLREELSRRGVTAMFITTALFDQMAADDPSTFRDLRLLIVGGEVLDASSAARVLHAEPPAELLNAYGPTEVTTFSLSYRIDTRLDQGPIPIGSPMRGTRAYVLDRWLRLAAPGSIGELCLAGDGLALGYAGRPDLTADRFRPDPYSVEAGARLYRTGDFARHRPDGQILFLGRRDRQVKVRGHRVELGEIEAALGACPAVRERVVVAGRDTTGSIRLTAYVVLRSDRDSIAGVAAFIADRLPEYLRPAQIIGLQELPLTANGKIDHARLPQMSHDAASVERHAARSPIEELIADIWTGLLGSAPATMDDDFFYAGGHSLLAMRLAARIREGLDVDLPLSSVFTAPSVAGLARAVAEARRAGWHVAPPRLFAGTASGEAPLSHAQEALWFLDRYDGGRGAYWSRISFRLTGPLDPARFREALLHVVRRHDVLRTRYEWSGERFVQVIESVAAVTVPLIDCEDLHAAAAEDQLLRLARREETRAGTASDVLFSAVLVRLSADHHALLMTAHHSIIDGVSVDIFLHELGTTYRAFSTGITPDLPALPVRVADHARWQRALLASAEGARLRRYWVARLAREVTASAFLPAAGARVSDRSAGALFTFELSSELTARIRAMNREAHVTSLVTLLSALLLVLHADTSEPVVQVGTDIAGRDHAELEPVIGYFANVLALRVTVEFGLTFADWLQRVNAVVRDALVHQAYPFDQLVRELRPERTAGQIPLIRTLFSLRYEDDPRDAGLPWEVSPLPAAVRARWDAALTMRSRGDRFHGAWIYSRASYDAAVISRLTDTYCRVLDAAAADAHQPISGLLRIARTALHKDVTMSTVPPTRPRFSRVVLPAPVRAEATELVATGTLHEGRGLPFVVRPAIADVDLIEWAAANRPLIDDALRRHGAVLFSGFKIPDVAQFERVARTISPELFQSYGDLPRETMSDSVYTATPYPNDQRIEFHNEGVHTRHWPLKIFFFCLTPAETDGETPIVDCREMARAIDPALLEAFATRKVRYVRNFLFERNYIFGLDVSWQEFFRTSNRAEVEAQCRAQHLDAEWTADNGLRVSATCPVVAPHPVTGELVLFHQLFTHHVSCLEPGLRRSVESLFSKTSLPRNVYYGDGGDIDDETVDTLRRLYDEQRVQFRWQEGDMMLVDNMLVAHGRNKFTGTRRICVAMGDMVTADGLSQMSVPAM